MMYMIYTEFSKCFYLKRLSQKTDVFYLSVLVSCRVKYIAVSSLFSVYSVSAVCGRTNGLCNCCDFQNSLSDCFDHKGICLVPLCMFCICAFMEKDLNFLRDQ